MQVTMNRAELRQGCVKSCPACPHRELTMAESLDRKQDWLIKRLGEFAVYLENIRSVSEDQRWNYRSKVCLAAKYDLNFWKIGVRKRDGVIPIESCPVHTEMVNRSVQLIAHSIPPADKFPLAYFLRSGAQMILVLKCRELPNLDWLTKNLKTELALTGVDGIWLHLNPSTGKKIFGKGGWHHVFGKPSSFTPEGLVYGPNSFQQVLSELHNDSVSEAFEFLQPSNNSLVIDLYSGTGRTLKLWNEAGSIAIGVELSGEAIACAKTNAPQAEVFRGTCAQRIPQMDAFIEDEKHKAKEILLYANPPRTGLESEVAQWIVKRLRPLRIAYLSCSAGTLYRDLSLFLKNGLVVKRIIPYDYFPQTLHVETLAFIEPIAPNGE